MQALARLWLLTTLPALAGNAGWAVLGEVVSASGAPAFADRPRSRTTVAARGQAATLDCRVLRLQDKSVSWVRSRDVQILSHAGVAFTADARVSAAETRAAGGGASSHRLRIERLRLEDSGRYECQVNTDPKLSLFFNLTVIDEAMPALVVSALRRRVEGAAGGLATLACEAHYEPPPRELRLPPLALSWRRKPELAPLSPLRPRGAGVAGAAGVALDTERWPARVESRLTLSELGAADGGEYECSAGDVSDTVALLLRHRGEEAGALETMQRDQWTPSGARGLRPSLLVLGVAGVVGARR